MRGRVLETHNRTWWVFFANGNKVEVNRYTGELRRVDSVEKEEDIVVREGGVLSSVNFDGLVGYVATGCTGLLLVITKGVTTGKLPGWPVHEVKTVVTSQWIRIPLTDPVCLFTNSVDLMSKSARQMAGKERVRETVRYHEMYAAKMLCAVQLDATHFWSTTADLTNHWAGPLGSFEPSSGKPDSSEKPRDEKDPESKVTGEKTQVKQTVPPACMRLEKDKDLWAVAEQEFVWNGFLAEPFRKIKLQKCCVVLLRGMCQSQTLSTTPNGADVTVTLVTRQRNLNPGTRYQARGLHGSYPGAGNEYECEMVLFHRLKAADGISARPLGLKYTRNNPSSSPSATKPTRSPAAPPLALAGSSAPAGSAATPDKRDDDASTFLPSPSSQGQAQGQQPASAFDSHPANADLAFSWASFVFSRGTVPLLWSQKLKSTDVSASVAVDRLPYRGVVDYWKGIWKRYGTSNFLIVNLLRNNAPGGVSASLHPAAYAAPPGAEGRKTSVCTASPTVSPGTPTKEIEMVPFNQPSAAPSPSAQRADDAPEAADLPSADALADLASLLACPVLPRLQGQEALARILLREREAASRRVHDEYQRGGRQRGAGAGAGAFSLSPSSYFDTLYILAPQTVLGDKLWTVRKSPSRRAPRRGTFRAGDVINVAGMAGGWLKLSNGLGWVMEFSDRDPGVGWYPLANDVAGPLRDASTVARRPAWHVKADISEEDRQLGIEIGYSGDRPALPNESENDDMSDPSLNSSDNELLNMTEEQPGAPQQKTNADQEANDEEECESESEDDVVDLGATQRPSMYRPLIPSRSRIRALREDGVSFKGEPLLGYFFEASLFAMDRYLERSEWERKGQPFHCQPPAQPGDGCAFHSTKIRHIDWHGSRQRIGEKKTVDLLWQQLLPHLKSQGVSSGILAKSPGDPNAVVLRKDSSQVGVIRVNCADSLDRTNLVCFQACIHVLGEQFRALAAARAPDSDRAEFSEEDLAACAGDHWPLSGLEHDAAMQEIPKTVLGALAGIFVDMGDVCAMSYCNSPAMHSGLLRSYAGESSQRQKKSNVGIALSRRYQNQFTDSRRTRSINLMLGRDPVFLSQSALNPVRFVEEEAKRTVVVLQPIENGGDFSVVKAAFSSHGVLEKLWMNTSIATEERVNAPAEFALLVVYSTPAEAQRCVKAEPLHRMVVASERYEKHQLELQEFLLKDGTTKQKAKTAFLQIKNTFTQVDLAKNMMNVKGGIAKRFEGFTKKWQK
ncbi:putative phosphoinositide phosphatase SAC9 [Diplonema papillatum]|nr:putative phosphoinositide phosphatase SAC9 [Diplonema papillatum]